MLSKILSEQLLKVVQTYENANENANLDQKVVT